MIFGRGAELRQIEGLLESALAAPAALLLEGPPGIGKTTLWMAGVDAAREAEHVVLATRAAESEARMSYTALGDLLEPVIEDLLPNLVEPQRMALSAALLRDANAGRSPDPRAVSLATASAISTLASSPLILAIDDVQWLDAPSARVLRFVIRRLAQERIGVIASLRVGGGSTGDPLELTRWLPGLTHVRIDALEADVLGRLLRERTGVDLPRPTILKIAEASRGNPLFALEIAQAIAGDERPYEPGAPLPVREDLQELLSARMAALPAAANDVVLAIAAMTKPTTELVIAAADTEERARTGIAQAERAGVIERSEGRIRLSHPLLGSTVYANAQPSRRRVLHLRLAELVTDAEERARHLALASEGASPVVARALEDASAHARARGAPEAAADLMELARRLTPADDIEEQRRRSLGAAEHHFDAGDAGRAISLLRATILATPAGPDRAEMLYRLSSMSWMNLINGVREPALQASAEAGDDAELQCAVETTLAWVAFYLGDLREALDGGERSAAFAEHIDDAAARADALATLGVMRFVSGLPTDGSMAEALELLDVAMSEASWTAGSVYTTPRSIFGLQLMWEGRLEEARAEFEHELEQYERHAMYTVRQEVLCYLAELECRAGRWQRAAELAAEAMETVVESGQTSTQSHVALFNQAYAAAHLGDVEESERMGIEGVRLALGNDDAFNAAWNGAALGFLELSRSNPGAAHAHLEPVVRYLRRMDAAEPGIIPCTPDEIEALVAMGDLDAAEELLAFFERRGSFHDRPWARATAARCHGLLHAARGDLEAATRSLTEAVEEHAHVNQPFELGRTLLVLGQVQRRAKRKRPARASLDRAKGIFSELGAPLWRERAENELARIGGRAPSPLELTPTEEQVARLVAEGRTNREVADALFVSPSTVQANLKRIFRKLDVRSRTELAARLGASSGSVGDRDQTYPHG